MPIRVGAPDGSVIEFPDGMDDAAIAGVMRKNFGGPEPEATPAPSPTRPPAAYQPNTLDAMTAGAAAGLTGNFFDEIASGAMTPIELGIGAWTGADDGKGLYDRVGDAYSRALEKNRSYEASAREAHPLASLTGDVLGSMATGGTLAKGGATLLNVAKPTLPNMAGRAAAEGALYGGVYGAGSGEGAEDRVKQAGRGAAVGGLIGGGLGAVAGRQAEKAISRSLPTADDLKAAGRAAYQASEDAGVAIRPEAIKRLQQDVQASLTDFAYHPKMQPMASVAVDEIGRLVGQGAPVTLKGMDTLRQMAAKANNPMNRSEAEAGRRIMDEIDKLIEGLGRPTPSGTTAVALPSQKAAAQPDVLMGDADAGVSALREARGYWRQARKSETIEDAVTRAERRAASTGSGGNIDNATRQNIRAILDSPKKARGFTDAEKAAMERAVRGTLPQNVARLVGKLSPEGNGLMAALNVGAAAVNPMMLGGTAAGFAAKRFADAATPRNVQSILDIIRSGGQPPSTQSLSGPTRSLLEALIQQGSIQGGQSVPSIP